MSFSSQDEQYMGQALDLARQGTALTSPGARVGAVVLDRNGEVAGKGFYTYDGIEHAEAQALRHAGDRARDGTLYLNLEPCSHHGRTPPCTDKIVAAGLKRVVAAITDPNPLVAGKGFARLRTAGIVVESGLLSSEARRLNENFARYILDKRPLVTLKSAMTLDGKIAGPQALGDRGSGRSPFITGAESRAHVQELRHEVDAIMVGVGTVLADDPLLTDRTGKPRRRPLMRVILDSNLRLPLESRIVSTSANDVVVFCSRCDMQRRQELVEQGIVVDQVSADSGGRPDLGAVIARLGEMEITGLLIEGGAHVNGATLAAGVADKIFFYYAPTILGSSATVPFACMQDVNATAQIYDTTLHRFGKDIAIEGYLHDPFKPRAAALEAQKAKERL
jgi:diaminohydroxyphosphoribosylaminopyrimidine deaminase/5-amino-6-(5-phosphoribosylamino)uracil reductase